MTDISADDKTEVTMDYNIQLNLTLNFVRVFIEDASNVYTYLYIKKKMHNIFLL